MTSGPPAMTRISSPRCRSTEAGPICYLFLQFILEAAQPGGPWLGVLAHPPVVDEPDGDRVQEVQLFASPPPGHHEARLFELLQMLHDAETRHRQTPLQCAERLPVFAEELVEEAASGWVGEGPEHLIHNRNYR